jgi:DNA-binding NtrC family response regulator
MKRILIVDDDGFLLQGLDKALQTPTTVVKTAETGHSALGELASFHYHLCFLDIYLPDLDGVEVLKKIKEISPHTKVIMMTAGVITPSMQENIEKDAYMFITKPFDLLQIRMLIKSILEEVAD